METFYSGRDINLISIFMLILLSLLSVIYLYSRYKLTYWKRRDVPQLQKTSVIFGDFKNALLFRTPPGYHVGEIYHKAPKEAPYVGFYIFHQPCLLLKDPKLIKQILIRDFDKFSNRHFAGSQQKDSLGMINLFGIKTPAWSYLRKKVTPSFTGKKLRQMLPLMMETGNTMMAYLNKDCASQSESGIIDAQDVNYKFAADLIANVALGTQTNSFNFPSSDYSKSLSDFFYGFKRMVALSTVFFMPTLVKIFGSPILFNSNFVKKIFWDAVEYREKNGNKRGDYIDSIVEMKNGEQNPLFKFEGDNLLHQSGIFFSGFESSATTASFTLMELARNKTYQDRVRDEVINATQRHGWTVEAFNEMKYLDQCIAESNRLYPSISTIDRETLQDYKIPGTNTVIEKGTAIFISLYGLHTDPKYFDEPKKYDPERFSNNVKNISPAFIPFGAGPRACIGMKAGILHVKVVLSMILSEYEVHLDQVGTIELDSRSIFTSAAEGIKMKFEKLTSKIN